jgi:hypothetical protein
MRNVVGFVLLIAVVVGVKMWNRGDQSGDVRAEMMPHIQSMPEYAANAAYLDECFDRAHSHAFSESYSLGGRRRAAKLDYDKYMDVLFTRMAQECRTVHKGPLADALFKLKSQLAVVPKEE